MSTPQFPTSEVTVNGAELFVNGVTHGTGDFTVAASGLAFRSDKGLVDLFDYRRLCLHAITDAQERYPKSLFAVFDKTAGDSVETEENPDKNEGDNEEENSEVTEIRVVAPTQELSNVFDAIAVLANLYRECDDDLTDDEEFDEDEGEEEEYDEAEESVDAKEIVNAEAVDEEEDNEEEEESQEEEPTSPGSKQGGLILRRLEAMLAERCTILTPPLSPVSPPRRT